jgi:hypothetical protein
MASCLPQGVIRGRCRLKALQEMLNSIVAELAEPLF